MSFPGRVFLLTISKALRQEDELIKLEVLSKAQSVIVRQLFEELTGRQYQFGLCHRDIALRNTVVGEDGLVSLLDYGCAEINIVPHTELATFLEWQLTENYPSKPEILAFLAGYGISQVEFRAMQAHIETLALLRAFDTLRWAIERHPPAIADKVRTARRLLEYKLVSSQKGRGRVSVPALYEMYITPDADRYGEAQLPLILTQIFERIPRKMIVELNQTQAQTKLPQLVALLQDAVNAGASIGFLPPLSDEAATAYWLKIFDELANGNRILLVALAMDGEQVAGSVQLEFATKNNSRHRAEVQKLIVHTQFRKARFGA